MRMSRKVLSKRYKTELLARKRRMERRESETDILMTSFTHPRPRRSEDDIQVLGASSPALVDLTVIDLTSPEGAAATRASNITPPLVRDEVVDLTESPALVLDSVIPMRRMRRRRNNNHVMLPSQRENILIVGFSDESEDENEGEVQVLSPSSTRRAHRMTGSSSYSGTTNNDTTTAASERVIICPVCMENEPAIRASGEHLTSTMCGHVFCNKCIRASIHSQHKCPTCRKKLTLRQIHPIFL